MATLTRSVAALLLVALALTGCSTGTETESDSESGDGKLPIFEKRYDSVEQLQADVSEAGLTCPSDWKTPETLTYALGARFCPDGQIHTSVGVYASTEMRDQAVKESTDLGRRFRDVSMAEMAPSILIGTNWSVEGPIDELREVHEALGGQLQDNTCADDAGEHCQDPTREPNVDAYLKQVSIVFGRDVSPLKDELLQLGNNVCGAGNRMPHSAAMESLEENFEKPLAVGVLTAVIDNLCPFSDHGAFEVWLSS